MFFFLCFVNKFSWIAKAKSNEKKDSNQIGKTNRKFSSEIHALRQVHNTPSTVRFEMKERSSLTSAVLFKHSKFAFFARINIIKRKFCAKLVQPSPWLSPKMGILFRCSWNRFFLRKKNWRRSCERSLECRVWTVQIRAPFGQLCHFAERFYGRLSHQQEQVYRQRRRSALYSYAQNYILRQTTQ